MREAERAGVVGSSSMPHKRNPRAPEELVQAGRTIPRLAEVLGDDVVNLFERDNTSRMTPVIEEISRKATLENATWKELLIEVANSAPFRETAFGPSEAK